MPDDSNILPISVADEMAKSFLDYSMSVIISRALPDARDGLKPSQRRILFAMRDLGVLPNRKHLKCAKIVGETMGNYHPHGDQAIYPTLVNMAQHWSMRDTLIEGQGNFGSVEGDPPASMRYTEARLTHLGALIMDDMDQETVDFVDNYDETRKEPSVFPAAIPNLLVNGGTGIAVGMATNIPPHNLGEVVDAICATIDNPDIGLGEILTHIQGPDFPTGCSILGHAGIHSYAETGRGSVKVRGRAEIETLPSGREIILITEIPFAVNRATLVSRIAELANHKILPEITGVRDESDENTRVVVELKRDARAQVVLNNLYKHTSLETSFAVNMLAIDNRKPRLLSLQDALNCYIEHRREVVVRRTRYQLRRAEERAEILEAYLLAIANLDEFIRLIRESKNREEAEEKLQARRFTLDEARALSIMIRDQPSVRDGRYVFSERQIKAILDLRLYQLTAMERDKIAGEYADVLATIEDLLDILAKEQRVLDIIKNELLAIKDRYATPRRTNIEPDFGEMNVVDFIANDSNIITISHHGFIKRTPATEYRTQARGGKGLKGMVTRAAAHEDDEADFVERLFSAAAHDYLMFFTNTGRVYVERVYQLPEAPRTSRGRSIRNLLNLKPEEKIAAVLRVEMTLDDEGDDVTWQQQDKFVLFGTRDGTVKKTALADFKNHRKDGIIAIRIDEGNELIGVVLTTGDDEILLVTRNGLCLRTNEQDIRPTGRPARGVTGIRPRGNDYVVALCIRGGEAQLLVVSENGLGKRTPPDEYRFTKRGGKGVVTMNITAKTGAVVGGLMVEETDELMLMTTTGQSVRIRAVDVRQTGRAAQGVKLMNLRDGEKIQDVANVVADEDDNGGDNGNDTEGPEGEPAAAQTEADAPDQTPDQDSAPPGESNPDPTAD